MTARTDRFSADVEDPAAIGTKSAKWHITSPSPTAAAGEERTFLAHMLDAEGIRRAGFHGLSYEHIASVLRDWTLGSRRAGL